MQIEKIKMENLMRVVLIEQDNVGQILGVKGPYIYEEAVEILENGHKKLGGDLYVPEGNQDWAIEWHYNDYNGTYWIITPIDNKIEYPQYLD